MTQTTSYTNTLNDMGRVKAPDIPPPHKRYTLHYVHHVIIKSDWWTDMAPRWESIDFKTLREAEEYKTIAGDNAYIIDNVTKKRVETP